MSDTNLFSHPGISFSLFQSLTTPNNWQITALAFGHAGHLYAGSGIDGSFSCFLLSAQLNQKNISGIDNGDLRVYDLSSFKVLRAVKGAGSMISAIVCVKRPGTEFRDAWVASGKQVCVCAPIMQQKDFLSIVDYNFL
jgi:hypothetical protein